MLVFFLNSLLSWKPRCAGYVMREFSPHLQGIIWTRKSFFSCVGRIQGATQAPSPSPNILKNWCNIHSETIFSRLNVCILSKGVWGGGGGVKWRRILVIRELLSCNLNLKCRYRWHWVFGFHFILIFLITPYYSPFSSSCLTFSYVPPIATSPLPHPLPVHLTCTLSTPHLPARRLIALVVTEPWIRHPIR